ncbi:MAG TPA: NADH:flavin oxidoreductase, partial [Hyphomonadaceae bacterium]|nr:NADH:flavin oxidoreductase [Hyphomonadaceae bacterium]
QFLSSEINHRTDQYGGSLENRARIILEIIDGIRAQTNPNFQLGLRLSPERFGLQLAEIRGVAAEVLRGQKIDFLDMSLWDFAKEPNEEPHKGRTLMSYFTDLPRGQTRLGAAGKIMTGPQAQSVLDAGADFAVIGRAAILRHDFVKRVQANANYASPATPVTVEHLTTEGLSPAFVKYMRQWPGFVEAEATTAA